ncbi:MAG: large subunit ribosomal protein [Clostridiales bacterium]|jgi:large subunit ribosomal protein L24|nr:large subunit ribosomal protein [Clostridiales bacterium]MDN5280947.1 large subunit ribosomal protein [Candidatus Ozemobacter sp.]
MHKKLKARRAVAKPHIKKDDMVVVLSGEDKGKKGRVLSVEAEKGLAYVEGVNFIKRHTRPNRNVGKGGIVEKEGPVAISNLGLLTPDGKKLTRAKIVTQGEEKNRVCAKTNEPLGRK